MIRKCPGTRGYIAGWHGLLKVEAEFRRGGAQYKVKRYVPSKWQNLDRYTLLAHFIITDSGERIDLLRRTK